VYPRAVVNSRLDFVPGAVIGASGGLVLRFARDDDAAAIIALISAVWSEYPGKTLVAAADMPELLRPASAYAACDGRFWVVEANRLQRRLQRIRQALRPRQPGDRDHADGAGVWHFDGPVVAAVADRGDRLPGVLLRGGDGGFGRTHRGNGGGGQTRPRSG
jgi:hypothetical protein